MTTERNFIGWGEPSESKAGTLKIKFVFKWNCVFFSFSIYFYIFYGLMAFQSFKTHVIISLGLKGSYNSLCTDSWSIYCSGDPSTTGFYS